MKILKILGVAFALLVAALAGGIYYIVSQADLYQVRLGPALEQGLGFAHGTPYLTFGPERREVITLHPTSGGAMAAAGVRNGDILRDFSITGFYKHLHQSRGSQVTLRVMDGGNGLPENQRTIRTIVVRVPPVPAN